MTGVAVILEFGLVSVLFGVVIVDFVILGTMQLVIKLFEVFWNDRCVFEHFFVPNIS